MDDRKRRKNGILLLFTGLLFLAFAIGILVLSASGARGKGSPAAGALLCGAVGAFLLWSSVRAFRGKIDVTPAPNGGRPMTPEQRREALDALPPEERASYDRILQATATPTSASSPTTARVVLTPKHCVGCGASLEAGSGFCAQCGKPVETYEEVRVLTSNDAASTADKVIGGIVAAAQDARGSSRGDGAQG